MKQHTIAHSLQTRFSSKQKSTKDTGLVVLLNAAQFVQLRCHRFDLRATTLILVNSHSFPLYLRPIQNFSSLSFRRSIPIEHVIRRPLSAPLCANYRVILPLCSQSVSPLSISIVQPWPLDSRHSHSPRLRRRWLLPAKHLLLLLLFVRAFKANNVRVILPLEMNSFG